MNTWQAMIKAGALTALLSCLPAAFGCAQTSPGEKPAPSSPGGPPEAAVPVVLKLQTDKKTYRVKEPIKMTLTARNTTKTKVVLNFSSGQRYDFVISKGKGSTAQTLWKWSKYRMFPQMIDTVSVDPGKSLIYSETYVPGDKGADGKPLPELPPGTYSVMGILTTMGRHPHPMTSMTLQIQ